MLEKYFLRIWDKYHVEMIGYRVIIGYAGRRPRVAPIATSTGFFCYAYCAPAGLISTNEPLELKLGSFVGTTCYLTNVFTFQSVAYRLSYELPNLASIFSMH